MKQAYKFMLAAVGAIGVTAAGVTATQAATPANTTNSPMQQLINALAQKFHLNTSDIQQVFEEQRQQMDAQRFEHAKEDLAQAVKDGKLTQTQTDQILAKQQELKATMESLKGKTRQEMEAARKTAMDALKTWATTNNIPEQYLHLGFNEGGRRGFGHDRPDPQAMLAQAVKDGKLTQAQADVLTVKQTEIKTFLDSLRDKPESKRQSAIQTQVNAWKDWAKANNIPENFIHFPGDRMGAPGQEGRGSRGHGKGMGMMGRGMGRR